MKFETWRSEVSALVSTALSEFDNFSDDCFNMFAVDLHPWNGVLVLALLTQAEVESEPFLSDPAEMAAWKNYDFAASLPCWQSAEKLTSTMRDAYHAAGEDRSGVAERYFIECARAVASPSVRDAIPNLRLSSDFRITIPHPDTGKEYGPAADG